MEGPDGGNGEEVKRGRGKKLPNPARKKGSRKERRS